MSIALRTKYLSIKKEKLSETGKTVLKSMYDATDGFKDAKATRKIKPKFEAFYDKLKKSKPEAIKGATKPKETPTAKQFKEARERRKSQTGVPKKESDIKKDADRPAIDRKGKRVTDGTHYPYKKGNVYYEYRDNRYDKRPAKYPKLEDGGMMANGGETFDANYWEDYHDGDRKIILMHPNIGIAELVGGETKKWEKENDDKLSNKDIDTIMDLAYKFHNKKGWISKSVVESMIMQESTGEYKHGGMMAAGGMTPGRWYKDNQGVEYKYIGEDMQGKSLFNDGERALYKSMEDFEPNVKENKMFGWFEDGGETHRNDGGDQLFADGGKTDNGNVEMVMSNTKAIEHHAQELKKLVDKGTPIEAWVVAKLERAETDLSDVTHYIDGLKSSKFADGGEVEGHDVEIFFSTKEEVADPYTVVIDGSVYSMSGTTGAYSVNLYVGEIDEFSPQAVKGWGKKINFVNADPELIKQIESRFEDEMADGGETKAQRERMYEFLKDDLAKLEKAIEENNQEEIEIFFSYWNIHLKSLEPKTGSKRMYEFLKDDLVGLEAATKELPSSKEETDRFFSYWNTHLKSLEYAKGGETDYSKQTSDDFKLGEIVWDIDNKRYGTIIGIYDQYASDKFEVRLDTDGMQPTENLRKVGSKGDNGTKEQLKEEIDGYARLVKSYPKNNYPTQRNQFVGQYAKGGRLSRKQKQLDLNKNGKLDSQDFKMLRAKRKNARKK